MSLIPPVTAPLTDRDFQRWCRESGDTHILSGTGSPEGVWLANRGTIFIRTDGGAGSTLYYKSTDGVKTGWVAV